MVVMLPHPKEPDHVFLDDERLYRRIEPGHVYEVDGTMKVSNLAVKMTGCSFHRSKYCATPAAVIIPELQPAATGAAALRVGDMPGPFLPPPENRDGKVHELYVLHTPYMCADPPLDLYPHSELCVRRSGTNDRADYWPNSARLKKQIRDDIADRVLAFVVARPEVVQRRQVHLRERGEVHAGHLEVLTGLSTHAPLTQTPAWAPASLSADP